MAITTSLISLWEFEETSGTRNDSHGTNHLTDNNTVGSATGKVGTEITCISAGIGSVANSAWRIGSGGG